MPPQDRLGARREAGKGKDEGVMQELQGEAEASSLGKELILIIVLGQSVESTQSFFFSSGNTDTRVLGHENPGSTRRGSETHCSHCCILAFQHGAGKLHSVALPASEISNGTPSRSAKSPSAMA